MIETLTNLTNHFLIAMPGMTDPQFARTVTYVCQHSEEGALGIIVNRPLELTLKDIMAQMKIDTVDDRLADTRVFSGGPIQPERGFVLHESGDEPWTSTLRLSDELSLTTSRDILEAMGRGEGPAHAMVALGYAGWGKGQLEAEIIQNAWLNAEAEPSIIFRQPPAGRWKAAAQLVGVDISLLTTQAGHG